MPAPLVQPAVQTPFTGPAILAVQTGFQKVLFSGIGAAMVLTLIILK